MKAKNIIIAITILFLAQGCASSGVGSYRERGEGGKITGGNDACAGGCLEYSENGDKCVKFTEGISQVCKDYINGLKQ